MNKEKSCENCIHFTFGKDCEMTGNHTWTEGEKACGDWKPKGEDGIGKRRSAASSELQVGCESRTVLSEGQPSRSAEQPKQRKQEGKLPLTSTLPSVFGLNGEVATGLPSETGSIKATNLFKISSSEGLEAIKAKLWHDIQSHIVFGHLQDTADVIGNIFHKISAWHEKEMKEQWEMDMEARDTEEKEKDEEIEKLKAERNHYEKEANKAIQRFNGDVCKGLDVIDENQKEINRLKSELDNAVKLKEHFKQIADDKYPQEQRLLKEIERLKSEPETEKDDGLKKACDIIDKQSINYVRIRNELTTAQARIKELETDLKNSQELGGQLMGHDENMEDRAKAAEVVLKPLMKKIVEKNLCPACLEKMEQVDEKGYEWKCKCNPKIRTMRT